MIMAKRIVVAALLIVLLSAPALAKQKFHASEQSAHWVGTWATAPQSWDEAGAPNAQSFADSTLRQIVHVSIGGKQLRVRFSNVFGTTALLIPSAHVALAVGRSAIEPKSDKQLTFQGNPSATISPGALGFSDPIDFDLAPLSDLVVTIYLHGVPDEVTMHRYALATSYLQAGNSLSAPDMPLAAQVEHWYFLNGVDVLANRGSGAVVVLGDSITDGNGSTIDGLARRLKATKKTSDLGVLNEGIGGNRLLHEHLGRGQNALARLDRDVLAQSGVRWLIVLEGINDIAERVDRERNGQPATAQDLIAGYEQIIVRAHSHHLRVYGATILPYEGSDAFSPEGEAIRQTLNDWIRTPGRFDSVIDFDAVTRDPRKPSQLSPAVDSGDHVHPGDGGYKIMYDAIDLGLFKR
jgi:lysophospholipase L1-like esterase